MKKLLTITGIFLFLLALLLVASGIYISRIDPNKYKGRISQYVYAKTGQVLVINGNMHWSLFPWVGLKANDLTYYNPPTFTPKIFISAKEMDIKIKLMPLLRRRIEIGNITLDNAVLNLIKNKSGQYNWQSIANSNKKEQDIDDKQNSKANTTISNLTIESLKIKNGKLNWFDQQKNSRTRITALNISSKAIQFGQPFPLSVHFILINDHNAKNLALDVHGDISLASDYQTFNFEDLTVKGEYYLKEKTIDIRGDGNLAADLRKQIMVSNVNFGVGNIKGQLTLKGNDLNKKPHLSGTLSADDFDLRPIMQTVGKPMNTKNNNALKSVSLLGKIDMTASSLQLIQLHAKVDKTDIFGNINLVSNKKLVRFNLTANEINLDDYLPDKDTTSKSDNRNETKNNTQSPLPWQINGTVKIANVNTDKFKLKNLGTTISVQNDIVKISPLRANLYSGNLEGSILIKKTKNKTAFYIKQSIKNVNIKELLHEFSDSDKLSGSANLTTDLRSMTDEKTNFLSALNGNINFALTNGSLQGIDIIYQLSRAHAFIKRLPSPAITDSKRTEFSALKANATVNNGVIYTDDLALTSDYLKVNGKGTTNLLTKEVRYHLNALAQPKLAAANNQIGEEITVYQVPIKVSGKLNKPSVNLDFIELAKVFYSKEIQKPISEKVTKNLNHLKDNLKDKVQEKIKDIAPSKLLSKLTKSKDETTNEAVPVETVTTQ
jgi:AsmA protein